MVHRFQRDFLDMQQRVKAVETFKLENDRLPTPDEFGVVIEGRTNTAGLGFQFAASRDESEFSEHLNEGPETWPQQGWVVYRWKGEYYDWYSSWDNYYSMSDSLTIWRICGDIVIVAAGLSVLMFSIANLRRFGKF